MQISISQNYDSVEYSQIRGTKDNFLGRFHNLQKKNVLHQTYFCSSGEFLEPGVKRRSKEQVKQISKQKRPEPSAWGYFRCKNTNLLGYRPIIKLCKLKEISKYIVQSFIILHGQKLFTRYSSYTENSIKRPDITEG